jgi:hypothetical protein
LRTKAFAGQFPGKGSRAHEEVAETRQSDGINFPTADAADIPFHNPYRKSAGFWNPIRTGKRTKAVNGMHALISAHPELGGDGHWSIGDLRLWFACLHPSILISPEIDILQSGGSRSRASAHDLASWLKPGFAATMTDAMGGSWRRLLAWCRRNLPRCTGWAPAIFTGVALSASVATKPAVGAAIGVALNTVDYFLLDKLDHGWKPNQFVEGPLRDFVKGSTNGY